MTLGTSLANNRISFSKCKVIFLPGKNLVLIPGICPSSSSVDPKGKKWCRNGFSSTLFSPGSVLITKAGLWATPFCHCFCRISVILTTPLSFGLSSAPCCSCINCRMAHLPSTTTDSCLGRIPLPVHAWPGDLWYFGWQTTCLCPAWYFPVKYVLGCPFFRRHYPSSHSFLSRVQASLHVLLAERSTPLCSECTSTLPVSSSLDSTVFQLRRCPWVLQLDTSAFPALLPRGDFLNVRYSCIPTPSTQSGGSQDIWLLFPVDLHTAAFYGYLCPLLPGDDKTLEEFFYLFSWEKHTCTILAFWSCYFDFIKITWSFLFLFFFFLRKRFRETWSLKESFKTHWHSSSSPTSLQQISGMLR